MSTEEIICRQMIDWWQNECKAADHPILSEYAPDPDNTYVGLGEMLIALNEVFEATPDATEFCRLFEVNIIKLIHMVHDFSVPPTEDNDLFQIGFVEFTLFNFPRFFRLLRSIAGSTTPVFDSLESLDVCETIAYCLTQQVTELKQDHYSSLSVELADVLESLRAHYHLVHLVDPYGCPYEIDIFRDNDNQPVQIVVSSMIRFYRTKEFIREVVVLRS